MQMICKTPVHLRIAQADVEAAMEFVHAPVGDSLCKSSSVSASLADASVPPEHPVGASEERPKGQKCSYKKQLDTHMDVVVVQTAVGG